MKNVPTAIQTESINSFQSIIRKSEKTLAQMKGKDANTSLMEKRLQAFHMGLAVLEIVWHEKPNSHSKEEIAEALGLLAGLLPSIESMYTKAKPGSPQRTLLEKRIKSMELAIGMMNEFLNR